MSLDKVKFHGTRLRTLTSWSANEVTRCSRYLSGLVHALRTVERLVQWSARENVNESPRNSIERVNISGRMQKSMKSSFVLHAILIEREEKREEISEHTFSPMARCLPARGEEEKKRGQALEIVRRCAAAAASCTPPAQRDEGNDDYIDCIISVCARTKRTMGSARS